MNLLIYPSLILLLNCNEIIENIGIKDIHKEITSGLCKKQIINSSTLVFGVIFNSSFVNRLKLLLVYKYYHQNALLLQIVIIPYHEFVDLKFHHNYQYQN
jgi:hypothetical protein